MRKQSKKNKKKTSKDVDYSNEFDFGSSLNENKQAGLFACGGLMSGLNGNKNGTQCTRRTGGRNRGQQLTKQKG